MAMIIILTAVLSLKIRSESVVSSAQIANELVKISELATYKNSYTDVFFIKDTKKINDFSLPFTTRTLIIKYSGYIKAGVDLTEVSIDIDDKKKRVSIKLNKASIIDNVIDTEHVTVLDERYTIFNEVDSQKIFDELNKNKAELAQRLIDEGFLEKANENAKVLIESILIGMGFKEVSVQII
jgi:hypothetical protein